MTKFLYIALHRAPMFCHTHKIMAIHNYIHVRPPDSPSRSYNHFTFVCKCQLFSAQNRQCKNDLQRAELFYAYHYRLMS